MPVMPVVERLAQWYVRRNQRWGQASGRPALPAGSQPGHRSHSANATENPYESWNFTRW